jgi:hypothetical protein
MTNRTSDSLRGHFQCGKQSLSIRSTASMPCCNAEQCDGLQKGGSFQ